MRSLKILIILLLALSTPAFAQGVLTGGNAPTVATKLIEIPGSTYKLRLYAKGQYGWYLTSNASTTAGETWVKDDPSINSQVLSISLLAQFMLAFDHDPRNASWTVGKRWVRWIGSIPQWRVGTTKDAPIFACSHTGLSKAARAGDVIYFSVPFPVALDTTPTGFVFSTSKASGNLDTSSLAVENTDAYHAVARVTVQADGDAFWVGCLQAG